MGAPLESAGFRDALEEKVGKDELQLRLQFPDAETDSDDQNELLRWPLDHLPRISVQYH